jgi:hypothetical protein
MIAELNTLDVASRQEKVRSVRRALQEQFPNTGSPKAMRIQDWENTLMICAHAKSTRAACEADCFTFRALLRYTVRTAGEDNEVFSVPSETSCYVKFAWKNAADSLGAFAERKIIGQDIEPLLRRRLTPCLPFAMHEFKLPHNDGLIGWGLYKDILAKSQTTERVLMKRATRHVHLFAMESCGETTLADYLLSGTCDNDILQVYLMLFHTLGVLNQAGISHNDLHLRNVVVQHIPPTIVRFSGRTFVTRAVPVIIDWDMGCSTRRRNRSLEELNHVGIFNAHNPLFDLFGVVKSLIWNASIIGKYSRAPINQPSARALIRTLKGAFGEVVARHPWLFAFEFRDRDGDAFQSIQQTPYFPSTNKLSPVSVWPPDIQPLTPSTDALQAHIHKLIEAKEGKVTLSPAYSFT